MIRRITTLALDGTAGTNTIIGREGLSDRKGGNPSCLPLLPADLQDVLCSQPADPRRASDLPIGKSSEL